MPPRSVGLLGAAIGGAELLARAASGFRAPELLLYPLVLLLAFRHGLAAGLASGLMVAAYLGYFLWRFAPPAGPNGVHPWRLALLAVVLAAAAAIGALRERLERMRLREQEAREAAEAASRRTHSILDNIAEGFVMLDPGGRFTYANPAAEALLGRSREEFLGNRVQDVIPPAAFPEFYRKYQEGAKQQAPVRFEASTPGGAWIEVNAASSPEGVVMHFRDITERRRHEDKLRSMTLVDELTGLYNRRGFFALAEQQRKLAERKGRGMLLVFADLDDLKQINDTFGHTSGDQALFEAAAVLRHTFRETDVVARIGGDEFAALVLESEPGTAPLLLRRLKTNVRDANAEGTLPFDLSLSFGVASFEAGSAQPIDELLSLADRRMYEEKRAKRQPPGAG